jgi:hypothetical protein
MIRAVALLVDLESALPQGFDFGEAVPILQQTPEIVEADRYIGMIRTVASFVDRERAADQRLGLGEAVRIVKKACEIAEAARQDRMGWTETCLENRQRSALEAFGLGVVRLDIEQNSKLIEKPRCRRGDPRLIGMVGDRKRVRRERIEDPPISYIVGLADESRVHPFQRFAQSLRAALFAHRPACEILHKAVNDEAGRPAVLPGHG